MKNLFTFLTVLIFFNGNSQVDIHFDVFGEIVMENTDMSKILAKSDLNGKPKNMSVKFSNIREQSKSDMQLEYNYIVEFDRKGYPEYYFMATQKQEKDVEESLKSAIFFDEKGILRKVQDGELQSTDFYDEKGNIVESSGVKSYYSNNKKITDSTFMLTKYKYHKNQILEKTQYNPTNKRDSLTEFLTTKNKLDAGGNIIEQLGFKGKYAVDFGTIPSYSKYDAKNNLIEVVTSDATKKLKYDADNNLTSVIITKSNKSVTHITYNNRKIMSRRVIGTRGKYYDIDYTYTYDKAKNWTNANLKFTFYNQLNIAEKRILNLDIIREINYYD